MQEYIERVTEGNDLTQQESRDAAKILFENATDAQIGALLTALRSKGEERARIGAGVFSPSTAQLSHTTKPWTRSAGARRRRAPFFSPTPWCPRAATPAWTPRRTAATTTRGARSAPGCTRKGARTTFSLTRREGGRPLSVPSFKPSLNRSTPFYEMFLCTPCPRGAPVVQ